MATIVDEIKKMFETVAAAWTSYAALGTFCLYLTGYLSLRFHLTTMGIGTDIALLDERYLYAGAKFWVYILLYIPVIIFVLLALLVLPAFIYLLSHASINSYFERKSNLKTKIMRWKNNPTIIASVGILFSILLIQLVMRQCLLLSNLVFSRVNAGDPWIGGVLRDIKLEVLFFGLVVAGTIITGSLFFHAWVKYRELSTANSSTSLLLYIFTLLFTIQFLLLPINHGVLVADKAVPRVKDLGGVETLSEGQRAWLVWEGSVTFTYLVETCSKDQASGEVNTERKLVSRLKSEIKRTEIIGYDKILSE